MPLDTLRVDKYLHHTRLFATRPLAVAACEKSNVRIAGQPVKPARNLHIGDILEVDRGELQMIVKVTGFPERRVGAALVAEYYENLTPTENYLRAAAAREQRRLTHLSPVEEAAKPTKKDLREIRKWLGRDD
jgi:ribosome-associated heat shock protein Hsp15